jgi:hypothetical protein
MRQIQLSIFPGGVTPITPVLAFSKQDGRVTYFNGSICRVAARTALFGLCGTPHCVPHQIGRNAFPRRIRAVTGTINT